MKIARNRQLAVCRFTRDDRGWATVLSLGAVCRLVGSLGSLLTVLAAPVVAQEIAQPEIAQLGTGEVWTRVEPGKNALLITVGTSLSDISGIVVREAGSEHDLARVMAESIAPAVAAGLSSRTTEASVTIDATTVEGNHRVRVPGSLESSSLETLLIHSDGSVYTFLGKQAPTDGWFETTLRFSGGERCVDITLDCENGCHTTKTCCGRQVTYCADCVECEITCPPCEINP